MTTTIPTELLNQHRDLTPEQTAAIEAFAQEHGGHQAQRKWREALSDGWMRAAYPGPLQQVRNQFGPMWLFDEYAWGWRATCPEWVAPIWTKDPDTGRTLGLENPEAIKWSGKEFAPPPIGAPVTVQRCGAGVVTGYFVEDSWLGVIVKIDAPSAGLLDRLGGNFPVHAFGAEITFAGEEG
jgi:hypothetical protein